MNSPVPSKPKIILLSLPGGKCEAWLAGYEQRHVCGNSRADALEKLRATLKATQEKQASGALNV